MTEKEREERLVVLLDDKFLNSLREVGKLYGWRGDYAEIGEFISELHKIKGIINIDTTPYNISY
jgi:hypothetical protein